MNKRNSIGLFFAALATQWLYTPAYADEEAPTGFVVMASTAFSVVLDWAASSEEPDGYNLYRSDSADAIANLDSYQVTYTDLNAKPSTTYAYRVCALYNDHQLCTGNQTVTTPAQSGNVGGKQSTPTPKISSVTATTNAIRMAYSASTAYEFFNVSIIEYIYSAQGIPNQTKVLGGTGGKFAFSGLNSATLYVIAVEGCFHGNNNSNCSSWATQTMQTKQVAPPPAPPPLPLRTPTNLNGEWVGGPAIALSWADPPKSATESIYIEHRDGFAPLSDAGASPWAKVATLSKTAQHYQGLYPKLTGTKLLHIFRVCAVAGSRTACTTPIAVTDSTAVQIPLGNVPQGGVARLPPGSLRPGEVPQRTTSALADRSNSSFSTGGTNQHRAPDRAPADEQRHLSSRAIEIQYSNDHGVTWSNYLGAYSRSSPSAAPVIEAKRKSSGSLTWRWRSSPTQPWTHLLQH